MFPEVSIGLDGSQDSNPSSIEMENIQEVVVVTEDQEGDDVELKDLVCSICHKTFERNVQLQNHLRNHLAERRFQCTYCDKAFSQSNNLRAHLRIHTNERPYKCTLCDKAFTQVTNLNNHFRLHTGERPFVCTEPGCNKAFAQVTNLNQHRKRHVTGKPVDIYYACNLCGEQFEQRNHMFDHRIRPQTPGEVVEGCGVCAAAGGAAGDGAITLGSDRAFTFDYAFDPDSGQDQVYDHCVRKLVEEALDGYNATVLAYGQTGSGKTYTMGSGWEGEGEEDEDRRGIIPRAIRDLFAGTEARAEAAREQGQLPPEFSVHAQFIELYNEDIVDLLDPARDPYGKGTLRITEDGCGGVRIVGASLRPVRGAREALGCLRAGALARTTAATNMNSSSSRSHAVFTLMLRQRRLAVDQDGVDKEENGEGPEQFEILTAKFHFVDLAGSERLKRTGATGDRAREGISINCGLLALGNVISALGDKSRKVSHVPYRDSKLTRLLQDSLGGNSNTVMIACVSPSDRDFMETLNTLKYANRARNIKNRCVLNQDLTSRTIHQLRQQIARLQLELTEYKQGKRVVSENGEEGWSDVVQENAILTGEVEALRRRVKAMQGTIEQLSTKNSELLAEKALGAWAPKDGSPDASECSLTTLVQGYVREIEELRAQLLEANAMYEASRKREVASRARLDSSVNDTASIIVDAKRELYKEKEILARSMGELEFNRKLNMSESMTSTIGEVEIGERERAEGESAESDSEGEGDAAQEALTEELATLSSEIDTKQRLIEELEVSQRRLAALRSHYETRLDTLHHQIKATQHERDKVLASYAQQASPPTDKLKRIREEYERRLASMSRELKRLQSAQKEHSKLQRTQTQTASQISTLNSELRDMKREKVKLVQRMRVEAKRHAAAEAVRAKEVAQLRKESRKNANLIRSLEAERRIKEQVLRRKQEEVSLLRKGHRDKLSSRAAGRLHDRPSKRNNLREVWTRVDRWLTRAIAAKSMLGELEASLERALTERERVRKELSTSPDPEAVTDHLRYLNQSIAETQQQIMQLEEENEENEFGHVVSALECACVCRDVLQRVCVCALAQGYEGARSAALLRDTRAQLRQLEESTERTASAFRAAEGQNMDLNMWSNGVSGSALAELLAKVSSGSDTRPVSPTISPVSESRPTPLGNGEREHSVTAPVSPSHTPTDNGHFQRNTGRRGSVRLRDLGVYGRDSSPPLPPLPAAAMTQSLMEPLPLPLSPQHVPLTRVPSAPGTLRGLTPIGNAITSVLMSPITLRRPPAESPRLPRRQNSLAKPSLESSEGTPPASPGMARRIRDDDVFLRLTATQAGENGPPRGTVKEYPIKRVSNNGGGGGGGGSVRLHCTHVAEGHAGAALALANTHTQLYSGGVDRTVRAWDVSGGGAERWRGWCGACVTSLRAAPPALLLAAAGAALRIFDTRQNHHQHTLWSSGASGNNPPARGAAGEVAITAIAVASDDVTVYTAVGDKLRIWDLRMMECLGKVWSGHAAAVMCLGVRRSLGGHLAVTGSKDHYVRMMELQRHQTGGLEATSRRLLEPPHYDGVQALALTADYLYSASRDTSLKRWHMASGTMTHGIMNAHKGWVTGVASVGEGPNELIASCGRDGAVKLWDTELKAVARPAALPDAAHCLVSHPDPNNMAIYTAGNGGDVRVWRVLADR